MIGYGTGAGSDRRTREVVLVVGPPQSGKSTYILGHAEKGEPVLLNPQRYWKSNADTMRRVYQFLAIAKWGSGTAWVELDRYKGTGETFMGCRVREVVRMQASEEECLRRLEAGAGPLARPEWQRDWCKDAIREHFHGKQ